MPTLLISVNTPQGIIPPLGSIRICPENVCIVRCDNHGSATDSFVDLGWLLALEIFEKRIMEVCSMLSISMLQN